MKRRLLRLGRPNNDTDGGLKLVKFSCSKSFCNGTRLRSYSGCSSSYEKQGQATIDRKELEALESSYLGATVIGVKRGVDETRLKGDTWERNTDTIDSLALHIGVFSWLF